MNPGATISPVTSITVAPLSRDRLPILAIRDPETPMSARYAGRPVPSSTDPPRRITSNGATRGLGPTPPDDGVAHAAATAIDRSLHVARTFAMRRPLQDAMLAVGRPRPRPHRPNVKVKTSGRHPVSGEACRACSRHHSV